MYFAYLEYLTSLKFYEIGSFGVLVHSYNQGERKMAWIFGHTSKKLYHDDRLVAIDGYSGHGDGKNNHSLQHVRDIGPIPVGEYEIGAPFSHAHTGPYSMRVTPANGTYTFGRSGFMIHGDSRSNPGNASKGCLVLRGVIREQIWNSGDRLLRVVHP